MCKHFINEGKCPLHQYCQFAHGPEELRLPNDPLPKGFGKTALGAVHSNYKTTKCKYAIQGVECKFGDSCSFYHDESDRRHLIDPLPNLPEGVTLPPMPEKVRKPRYNKNQNFDINGPPMPMAFNPLQPAAPMIQINSMTDLIALGGFNPNKYMQPMPAQTMPFNPNAQGFQPTNLNQPAPQAGQNKKGHKSPNKNMRYKEKQQSSGSKNGKKDKTNSDQKRVFKQKETSQAASQPV